ncbi:MAG: hypothetical protein RIF32_24340 [Leptospirales bacterium]|jgi:YD repeat-containing protein
MKMIRIASLTIAVFGALICVAQSLHAFQPVRWSPMDAYILKPLPGGPQSVQVLDPAGRVLSSARYIYDGAGRLIEERFAEADGTPAGSNVYEYKAGRLQQERLIDAKGKIISRTKFFYKNDVLVGMEQFDRNHKLISRQDYAYRDGRIYRGVETTGAQKDQFQLEYKDDKPIALTVKNNEHGRLNLITYQYDEQGRTRQRIREAFGNFSRCDYSYDERGRIQAYAYYNRVNGEWEREKKLQFSY